MKNEIESCGLEYQKKIEGWKCLKRLGIYSIWATQTKAILSCNYIHQYKFFDTLNEAYEYYKTYISRMSQINAKSLAWHVNGSNISMEITK